MTIPIHRRTNAHVHRSTLPVAALLILSSMLLSGCGGSSSNSDSMPQDDSTSLRELNVAFTTPERLQLIGTALSATVAAGGTEQTMQAVGAGFQSTLLLLKDQQLQVYVGISRSDDGMLLAAADATVWLGEAGAAVSLPVQRFVYDFDLDGDGISNLLEIERGSSPTSPSPDADGDGVTDDTDNDGVPDDMDAFPTDPDEVSDTDGDGIGDNADEDDDGNGIEDRREGSQIVVPYVDNAAITIDGIWTEYYDNNTSTYYDEWGKATDSDSYGYSLTMENLMSDNTGRYANSDYIYNDNYAYFEMMHDGTYLYIKLDIYGEQLENWFNDSTDAWMDDSVELYFDVGYDQQETYGDDDYQRIFRFRDTVANPTIDGPNSASGLLTDYVTSYRHENNTSDVYEQYYEFRVSLSSIGLKPGETFGFEMAYNDDDDGGERDYKWGWWSPLLTDEAWLRPSVFGKATLQPVD
ncbi:MAG: hypothetical protein HKN42_13905 [Granulosicoccus sp.]|nr:hypothetical protein [Granulosicoccus sp.]